jgi:hypothetical protein
LLHNSADNGTCRGRDSSPGDGCGPDGSATAPDADPLHRGAPRSDDAGDPGDGLGCETVASAAAPDGTVEIEVCTTSQQAHDPDGAMIEYQREGSLVRKPAGTREVLSSWSDGWEWGTRWQIAGTLTGPRGAFALLVTRTSFGPAPDLSATSIALFGFLLQSGGWQRIALGGANLLEIDVASDHESALVTFTVGKDNDPDPAHGEVSTERIHLDGADIASERLTNHP